jgi:hypothetical protein
VDGPPAPRPGRRAYAAPGRLRTPPFGVVEKEVERARGFFPSRGFVTFPITLVADKDGRPVGPGSDRALSAFLKHLGHSDKGPAPPGKPPTDSRRHFSPAARQRRQVEQFVEHTQELLRRSGEQRRAFWSKAKTTSPEEWHRSCAPYRAHLRDEIVGRFPDKRLPLAARTRRVIDRPKWAAYEVVLDVWPEVFGWGLLLVPKGLAPGERRPVVVCQHGLEGLPFDVINEDGKSPAFALYKAFAVRLAERGFVVYAPHNPYRGGNRFRQLQRRANPLGKTLFSVILAQHEAHLDWLASLPFVDAGRIAFYGLSYGGFSAMRLPPLLERYAVVINSAEFNDMAWKAAGTFDVYSYPFYNTYEVFEFDIANRFGYADLAGLIAPRPFMVERGHRDGVAPDEWVASEYARARRLYALLGLRERTAIDWFDGPHTIHGVGSFDFLHHHLRWPRRADR